MLAVADASDDADAGFRFPSDVTITESVIAGTRLAGVQLQAVTATVDRTLIANTRADARGCPLAYGDGITVYSSEYVATDAIVVASRIETAERAALASFGPKGHVTVASAALHCNDAFGIVRDVGAAAISLLSPRAVVCSSCEGNPLSNRSGGRLPRGTS